MTAPQEIWTEVLAAAQAAALAQDAKLVAEGDRGLDCGFAWITISPARGPLVTYLKKTLGPTRSYGGAAGYGVWYSRLHDVPTQSISVHQAAVAAAVEVLAEYNIRASTGSRYD
jgi:hypothetical protein